MKTFEGKTWDKAVWVLIILFFLAKLSFDLFGEFTFDANGWKFLRFTSDKKYEFLYNPDEIEVARTAKYFITTHDFLTDICFDRPNFYGRNQLRKTAFRPKFTILVHVIGIHVYSFFHPELDLSKIYDLPDHYFHLHALIIFIVKNLLLALALWIFYKVNLHLYTNIKAQIATLVLLLYPSVIYYVGILNIYECIITAGLVICLGQIYLLFEQPTQKYRTLYLMVIGISLAVFGGLKSQILLINALIFVSFAYLYLIRRKESFGYLIWLTIPTLVLILGVILMNHHYFGQYVFSTQGSLNFWHGHNPFAKGSWTPNIWHQNWKEIQPILEKNKAILSQDEATETAFYGKWALNWIIQNPTQEIFLIIKKTAILFVPHNMMKWNINPITALFHLAFPYYLFLFFKKSLFNQPFHLFSLAVILGVWLMSIIFFVDYRWRFFADPFIVFVGFYTSNYLLESFKQRKLLRKL